jgi:hypothetical protein
MATLSIRLVIDHILVCKCDHSLFATRVEDKYTLAHFPASSLQATKVVDDAQTVECTCLYRPHC